MLLERRIRSGVGFVLQFGLQKLFVRSLFTRKGSNYESLHLVTAVLSVINVSGNVIGINKLQYRQRTVV